MANYQYQPLHGPRNIRLLWLEPAKRLTSPLRCKLNEVSLDQIFHYEALSYSCEKQDGCSSILIFNIPSEITKNCEAALRRLRYNDKPRVLWVDSICINQDPSALPERSHQVLLMREIYSRAAEVLVWLGEVDTATSKGFIGTLSSENLEPWKLKWESNPRAGIKYDLPATGGKLFAHSIAFVIIEVIMKPILMLSRHVRMSIFTLPDVISPLIDPSIEQEAQRHQGKPSIFRLLF
jgi:hypothetical protein